jgi:hypothetical protein
MFLYPNIPYFHHFHHPITKKNLKNLCVNIKTRYRYKKNWVLFFGGFNFLGPSTPVLCFTLALFRYGGEWWGWWAWGNGYRRFILLLWWWYGCAVPSFFPSFLQWYCVALCLGVLSWCVVLVYLGNFVATIVNN